MRFLVLSLVLSLNAEAQTQRSFEKFTPVGTIIEVAGSCPSEYLPLNGQEISRSTYSNLFSKLGVTYGSGNGSTTFNLPSKTASIQKIHYITFTGASSQTTNGLLNGHAVGTIFGDALLAPTVTTNPSLRFKAGTYGTMSCYFAGRCRAGNGSGSTCTIRYLGTNPEMRMTYGTAGSSGTTNADFSKTIFDAGTYEEREFQVDFTNVTPAASPSHNISLITCVEIQENAPSLAKCIKI